MSELAVPYLRSGVGETPAQGGCIMQVISWLHDTGWVDDPPCVHPVLRRLAIWANDEMVDADRQKLLDLAPRLMGTASDDRDLAIDLATFLARKVLHLYEDRYPGDDRPRRAIEAAERRDVDASAAYASAAAASAAYAAASFAASAAALIAYDLLLETLDEFDRLTNRPTPNHVIDWTPVCEVMGCPA